jgi:NAD(P)H-flavin reductase
LVETAQAEGRFLAKVARTWRESFTLRGLALTAAPEVAARYQRPGQFVTVYHGGEESPFALASEPGADLELLVKKGKPLNEALVALPVGSEVQISAPTGKGFPVDDHEGMDLLLCAAGSGIAPLRGVIRSILPRRDKFGKVRMFYGQRHPSELAYVAEHREWRAAGVEITLIVSGMDESWSGDRGYVQDAVKTAKADWSKSVAYVVGKGEMIDAVRDVLGGLGVPAERVYRNY